MPIQKGPANLGTGSVDSTELSNTLDLSAKTVTYRTIVAGDIASNAITTAKVADTAITSAKMANSGAEMGMRNRIINGAMVIDQRNAGASSTVANTGGYFSVDRWRISNGNSTVTVQQSSSVIPTGFANSLGLTVSTTDSTGSHAIQQYIEGFNTSDLGCGTANAVTFTLSFWVRSSLTGLYGVGFQNSAQSRSYVGTYTINSANTWEQKTITVAGDTSGTWIGATNGIGLSLEFDLGSNDANNQTAGSWGTTANARRTSSCVKWANTAGATFYITGVQLEKGSTATSFDYRPYGTELALCQRYCFQMNTGDSGANNVKFALGTNAGTTQSWTVVHFPVQLRTYPTLTVTSTASNYGVFQNGDIACSSVPFINSNSSPNVGQVIFTVASGLTANGCSMGQTNSNNTAYLRFNAEL
jgi:hypothetical protein